MSAGLLLRPSDIVTPTSAALEIEEGDTLPRDGRGRPRIFDLDKGALRSWTRTTTYIDVIEDKSNLDRWGKRMVLAGTTFDSTLIDKARVHVEALTGDPDDKKAKDALNRLAENATELAGANVKREKGSQLHKLSEFVDKGEPLPPCTEADMADMLAYRMVTMPFDIKHIESPVVHDEIKVAGTPDRTLLYSGPGPEGIVFKDDLLIGDLKTGTIEYGGLKMAMQLAIYSRAVLYDPKTEERTPFPDNLRTDWGVIINLPAGTGVATLHWVDLDLGWEAVKVAGLVRDLRRRSKKALTAFPA